MAYILVAVILISICFSIGYIILYCKTKTNQEDFNEIEDKTTISEKRQL